MSAPTVDYTPPPQQQPRPGFDPEEYRMSIGDHLEELRRRILLGGAGFVVAAAVCLVFGNRMVSFFCRPLVRALQENDINPQLVAGEVTDGFMVYLKISLICAGVIAGPWMIYQLWQFVAAGLYAHERKYITKYIPLSIFLLVTGMFFVYVAVLPLTLRYFLWFTTDMPLPIDAAPKVETAALVKAGASTQPTIVQAIPGDPADPKPYELWFDTSQQRLKMLIPIGHDARPRIIPFGSSSLVTPMIHLPDYIDLVLRLLLMFGLAFQLPLVVLALNRIGIVDLPTLRRSRRYVYFGLSIVAAALTPGDVVTAFMALLLPLVLLYEFGLFLASWGAPKTTGEAAP